MAIAFRMKKNDPATSEVSKFHKACMEARLADVKSSLDRGVGIEEKSGEYGITALLWASMYGKEDCVEFLLSRGATVNAANNYGRTALVYATIHNHLNVVSCLLNHGALVYISNRSGKTAFDWAKTTEMKDLLNKAMIYERRRNFLMFLAFSHFLVPQPKAMSAKEKLALCEKFAENGPCVLSSEKQRQSGTRAEKVLGTRDLHRQIMAFL